MKNTLSCLAVALMVGGLLSPAIAMADSTTWVDLNVASVAKVGTPLPIHVSVGGKHIAFGGAGSITGGNVVIYDNGTAILSVPCTTLNTTVTEDNIVYVGSPGYFHRYKGQPTVVDWSYSNNWKPGETHTITARFTGDDDSHSSNSSPVVVIAKGASIAPAIDMLLGN